MEDKNNWNKNILRLSRQALIIFVMLTCSILIIGIVQADQAVVPRDQTGFDVAGVQSSGFYSSDVATDGTTFFSVWRTSTGSVVGQFFDLEGTKTLTSPVLFPSGEDPCIASDGSKYLVVTKVGTYDIYGRFINNAGIMGPSFLIGTGLNTANYPDVVYDSSAGKFLVVWSQYPTIPGVNSQIFGRFVDSSGAIGTKFQIGNPTIHNWHPIVTNGTNQFFVAWTSGTSAYDVYGTRLNTNGVALDSSDLPICTASGSQDLAAWFHSGITFDGINYIVIWRDYTTSPDKLYGARITSNGDLLDGSGANGGKLIPGFESTGSQIVYDGNSRLLIGERPTMQSARLDSALNVIDPAPIPISTTWGDYTSLVFGGGKFFVTWVTGSGSPYTLRGQILVYDERPVAVTGPDKTVSISQIVSLDGSASNDPDHNVPLTYSWSFLSRPTGSVASITNPLTAAPSFTPDKAGDYVIQLIVKDTYLLASAPHTITVTATSPVHNLNSGISYATIPEAITAAAGHDVITVDSGTYGGFFLDKPLTIRGNTAGSLPVIDYNGFAGAIIITASGTGSTIENFVINYTGNTNPYSNLPTGVDVFSSDNTIKNVVLNDFYYGIKIHGKSHNMIQGCTADGNLIGVYIVDASTYNTIDQCIIRNGGGASSHAILIGNSAASNNNIIKNSDVSGTYYGIGIGDDIGVSTNNRVEYNLIHNNYYGITLEGGSNTIKSNQIYDNTIGAYVATVAVDNLIYDNKFNQGFNANVGTGHNDWNVAPTTIGGPNILTGARLGGNYWAQPDGLGFSQKCTNPAGDEFCDGVYDISTNNVDNFPLTDLANPDAPVALFSATPLSGVAAPSIVTFTDTSTGTDITNRVWEYRQTGGLMWIPFTLDGSNQFTFANAGTYDIQLTVTNAGGFDPETKIGYIKVNSAPTPLTAVFSSTIQENTLPLDVQFYDMSQPVPISTWLWDFGDFQTSTQTNPHHIYAGPGPYVVTLTVTNGGSPVSSTQTITRPTGGIHIVSNPPGAEIWSHGEGWESIGVEPITLGGLYDDSYTWRQFKATLPGYWDQVAYIVVSGGLTTEKTFTLLPLGSITADPGVVNPDDDITFGYDQTPPVGTTYDYNWNFDDGIGTSTDKNPIYAYSAEGYYHVTLEINDGGENSGSLTKTIKVGNPAPEPVVSFTATPGSGPDSLTVQFTDTSTGFTPPLFYEWYFLNDINVDSTEQNPSYTFAVPGTYVVYLDILNGGGNVLGWTSKEITVTAPTPLVITQPQAVTYGVDHYLGGVPEGNGEQELLVSDAPVPANTVVTLLNGKTITAPAYSSWLNFINEDKNANWEHPVKYVFVGDNGQYQETPAMMPPADIALSHGAGNVPHSDGLTSIIPPFDIDPACPPDPAHNYALLISGGGAKETNYGRYYNDIQFMYKTLVNDYQYSPSHIKVLMSDGGTDSTADRIGSYSGTTPVYVNSDPNLDGKGISRVTGIANHANVDAALDSYSTLTAADTLFIFTTAHGAISATNTNTGDANNNAVDLLLWGTGEKISDADFDAKLPTAPKIIMMMEQCNGGGFINNVIKTSGSQTRVLATAATGAQSSHSNDFSYYWITGVSGHDSAGNTANADLLNVDWRVAMNEAFSYANARDPSGPAPGANVETPQFREYGTGAGATQFLASCAATTPTITVTQPGTWAAGTKYYVKWTSANLPTSPATYLKIELMKGTGLGEKQVGISNTVLATLGSTGVGYTVPVTLPRGAGNDYWIKISTIGIVPTTVGQSSTFSITGATVPTTLGTLTVKSTPSGAYSAEIFMNDVDTTKNTGTTGAGWVFSSLVPLTYPVYVTKAGYYQAATVQVPVPSGSYTQTFTMIPLAAGDTGVNGVHGSIAVTSVPQEGFEVFLDGTDMGYGTPVIQDIGPGSHTVRLEMPGYKSDEQIVTVVMGEQVRADFDLTAVNPTFASISPATGPLTGGTPVTITGTDFVAGDSLGVTFGGVAATDVSVTDPTHITATTPAGTTGSARDIVITNGNGGIVAGNGAYTYAAVPAVTGIDPKTGPLAGGTTVTITGTGFTGATAVNFGITAATTFNVVSDTSITAKSPAGSGIADVTIITAGGTSAVVTNDKFTYTAAPTFTSIAPSSGPLAGGTPVTIIGSGFVDGGSFGVKIGGVSATSVVRTSATQITAVTPSSATAVAKDVVITNNNGQTTTGTGAFTYTATVPPVLGEIVVPLAPVKINTKIDVNAALTPPNSLDKFTATWTWNDGTSTQMDLPAGTAKVSSSHLYTSVGVYTVSLKVTDKTTGLSADKNSLTYVVVYDPAAGYVVGAGTIDSPAGAYLPDTSLKGIGFFGFESKYKAGVSKPQGVTAFYYNLGSMNFFSNNYDWLVVLGPKASFKGSGTINGKGDYGFLITATDGAIISKTTPDKFRIRIWNKTPLTRVYDNMLDAPDDADPTTVIKNGFIIIQK